MKRVTLFILLMLLFAACSSTGGTQTQSVDLSYPDADPVTLNLDTTAGTVTVSAADAAGVSGTLSTNVGAWVAQTSTSGSTITIQQGRASADVIPEAENTWDLKVGRGKPLIINQTNTGADTIFNLGGLTLSAVNVTATTGNYTVSYGTPNPADDGGTASFEMTNGDFLASGVSNSHLSSLTVTTTGGNVQMAFDGTAITQNMSVRIETSSGNVLLKIPATATAQVIYRTSSGALLETDPQYQKVNDITYTVGDTSASATPRINIEIRTVVGDLRLAGA